MLKFVFMSISTKASFSYVKIQDFVSSGCKCVISDYGGRVFILQIFFKVANRAVQTASGSGSDLGCQTDENVLLTERKRSLSTLLHKVICFWVMKNVQKMWGNKKFTYLWEI